MAAAWSKQGDCGNDRGLKVDGGAAGRHELKECREEVPEVRSMTCRETSQMLVFVVMAAMAHAILWWVKWN